MSTGNVELAKQALIAMNAGDVNWLIAHSDTRIELHMEGAAGEPVRYVGAAGVRDYFKDLADIWQSVEFLPESIEDQGDHIFMIVVARFRGRGSGLDVEQRVGCICRLRDGVVTELHGYRELAEARAAGLDP